MRKRWLAVGAGALVLAQAVPVDRTNAAMDASRAVEARLEVPPAIDRILNRSCYDCHSERTTWPWYSRVAPASWLVAHDVSEARRKLNFSNWAAYNERQQQRKLGQICEEVKGGDMPLWYYTPMHPGTKLSTADRQALCQWTEFTEASLKNRGQ
jgi:hypothetical protein